MIKSFEKYYELFLFKIDKIFILPYKFFYAILKNPLEAYFLGTLSLSFIALLIGKFLWGIVLYINKDYIKSLNEKLVKWYNLSIEALETGESENFHYFNKKANEYFGKLFFLNIAQSVSLLLILPLILAWLELRFGKINFPLPVYIPFIGDKVNYIFTFLMTYILSWLIYKKIYKFLPVYKDIEKLAFMYGHIQDEMKSMAEVLNKKMKISQSKSLQ